MCRHLCRVSLVPHRKRATDVLWARPPVFVSSSRGVDTTGQRCSPRVPEPDANGSRQRRILAVRSSRRARMASRGRALGAESEKSVHPLVSFPNTIMSRRGADGIPRLVESWERA